MQDAHSFDELIFYFVNDLQEEGNENPSCF
jgi:hypothetical protein